ncbi:MAG: metallophosphoesterase [Aigarchaeota archaeon]|nr:metallophosphoesterase [Aigarchaeota archaeon]MCX8192560.1 metallophosphoesterase [Nitrososphaeria archaeon]MDW7985704.1 metallophosphoesterase [Nitrososphaerota archaeon]
MSSFKIFFVADIHNSDLVFRKFLSIPKHHDVDVMILSGDLTGKAIIPIIDLREGCYQYTFKGKTRIIKEQELDEVKNELRNCGVYPYVCSREEVEELKKDPEKVNRLFSKLIIENIHKWTLMIEEHIDRDKQVITMPGNDDIFDIDPVLKRSERDLYPLGRMVELPHGYGMISFEYVNPTPWNTPREADENKLWKMLEDVANLVDRDWSKIICCFHPPPYNTIIDVAPKLDKNLRPVYHLGEIEKVNVGSRSVRKFLETYKPLIGLHGHIHESPGYDRVEKTIVFNPGSEYSSGILKGLILEIDKNGLRNWYRIG